MFSSEQKFLINGEDTQQLSEILKLAVRWQSSGSKQLPAGVKFDHDHGTVFFYWHSPLQGVEPLPKYTSIETLTSMIWDFLNDGDVKSLFTSSNKPLGIDGGLEMGWQVFIPQWNTPGVDHQFYAFLAVKPDWIYFAK